MKHLGVPAANAGKFRDPKVTADGQPRATVTLSAPETLWFNTGTLCNIACLNCYIESSPTNDALVYLTKDEVRDYLDQLGDRAWPVREIGFTGGEPFMNPDMIAMARLSLERGYDVLILTNAMRPMMRDRMRTGLLDLQKEFGHRLTLRVSVDHHSANNHDAERGAGSFQKTLDGMIWLRDNGFRMTVAGRTMWNESDEESRSGYAAFYARHRFDIDPKNPAETVLFPEMDLDAEVPEITTACWG
ncbi:MAG: radical SAM protein, partial [Pseudomonadota bacterium]